MQLLIGCIAWAKYLFHNGGVGVMQDEETPKKKSVKRYFWLKLKEEFFQDKEIKKLRRIAGGDTYTIIYLKLMLLSLKSDGRLYFDGIEDSFYEELALEIDEDPENVKVTLMYLEKMGLVQIVNEDEMYLTQMDSLILSESESAKRVRAHRAKLNEISTSNTTKKEAKSNALRQKQFRAKEKCAEQHIPYIEDYTNNKRYSGNYYLVIKRDGYRCALCGDTQNLCVHHIDGFDEDKPQNNAVNKMITLCRCCHSNVHAGWPISEDILNSIQYYQDSNEMLPGNADVTECNADETNCNTYTYTDTDTDTNTNTNTDTQTDKKKKHFPPTVEEVAEYCRSRGNDIDAEEFVNYYNGCSWYRGKTKITNWKNVVVTWEKRREKEGTFVRKDNSPPVTNGQLKRELQ